MLIGELVKRSGMTKDAIRFYERKGLISLDKKQRRDNNYKEYSEQVLERLILIKTIKRYGFTINEIDSLLERSKPENSFYNLMDTIDHKVVQIDDQIKRLTELREKLASAVVKCKAGDCEFDKSFPHVRGKNACTKNQEAAL